MGYGIWPILMVHLVLRDVFTHNLKKPDCPSPQFLRFLIPNIMPTMGFATRVPQYFGSSGPLGRARLDGPSELLIGGPCDRTGFGDSSHVIAVGRGFPVVHSQNALCNNLVQNTFKFQPESGSYGLTMPFSLQVEFLV